jgi:hypothetical protein
MFFTVEELLIQQQPKKIVDYLIQIFQIIIKYSKFNIFVFWFLLIFTNLEANYVWSEWLENQEYYIQLLKRLI